MFNRYHQIQEHINSLGRFQPILVRALNHKLTPVLIFFLVIGSLSGYFVNLHHDLRTLVGFFGLIAAFWIILYPDHKAGRLLGFMLVLLLIFTPYYWRLQGFDTDGYTVAGIFPQSDANGYFTGALRILYGEEISAFAARRPLFSAFLSVLLFISNQNFVLTLLLLSLVIALSIYIFGMEVGTMFGTLPSAMVIIMLIYSYTGKFQGRFLTEQLGLPLGLLAMTLLLRGTKERNLFYVQLAVLILSVGLNARAGAFFVLPFLALWLITLKGRMPFSKVVNLGIGLLAILLGFFANVWLVRSLSDPGAIPFNNFGDTLYGMATGYRGWRAFQLDFPNLEAADTIPISIQLIRDHPFTIVTAVLQAYRDFFKPTILFSFLYLPGKYMITVGFCLTALMVVGLYRLLAVRKAILAKMLFFAMTGILLSVPFVPPIDDGIRAMMVTVPFWMLWVSLSFANLSDLADDVSLVEWQFIIPRPTAALLASLLMLVCVILGWLFVKGTFKPNSAKNQCKTGEYPISLVISTGSYLNVVPNNSTSLSWLPNIRKADVRKNANNFRGIYSYEALKRLEVGQSILVGLNLADATRPFVWFITPTDKIQTYYGVNNFCALETGVVELNNANFYIDQSLRGLFQDQ